VAVLEDDLLTEIFIERHRHRSIVGNLYKGRVTRVLPGMQAAFVDIGLERDAFLYVSDVGGAREAQPHYPPNGGHALLGRAGDQHEDDEAHDGHDEDNGLDLDATHGLPVPSAPPSIDELLQQGQELLVQVVKAPLPNKGARITTQVTLPGRYLVLLPRVRHFAVSRRIEDADERARLLAEVEEVAPPEGGLIVRTVGEGRGRSEFAADCDYLWRRWERIQERSHQVKAPRLVHQEQDLALRVVRDLLAPEFNTLLVDGEETYARIVEFLDQVQPALLGRVKLFAGEGSLFEQFSIGSQIEAALAPKVWLKSGGYLVINQTEALVAIDVNTGRFVGRNTLEETVLATNLEAVEEVVRQIRLRDLGGIIVVDLIDMVEEEHRQQVFAALEAELARDRAKTKVLSISEFGLVEITRKRSRTNLERLLTQSCPYCTGTGRIKSITTICLELRREVLRLKGEPRSGEILLRVHPDVARALQGEERDILSELERVLGTVVLLKGDPELHRERFDLLEV
jgi:ribonuclease G